MAREVIMPKFGFTQETAEIVHWLKKAGDAVEAGDPIAEVTTDKVNMEVEAPASGILTDLRYKEGDIVPVTEVIAYILAPGEALPATAGSATQPPTAPSAAVEAPPAAAPQSMPLVKATPLAERIAREAGLELQGIQGSGPSGKITRRDVEAALNRQAGGKVRAVPAARRLAREAGVELAEVAGSGPSGRVQSADVQRFLAGRSSAAVEAVQPAHLEIPQPLPAAPAELERPTQLAFQVLPLAGMRRTIAQRLQKSAQEAPHINLEIRVDVTQAEALRARANQQRSEGQPKVSLTAVLAKACAWALKRNPYINAWLQSTPQGEQIVLIEQVNLGIAVALKEGLIVPVVQQSESKGLLQLAQEMDELTARARENRLRPEDVADGTFTISNLGMFGVERFTAIINPPQVAILAVGTVRKEVVADENDQVAVRPMINLTLCADHRVVDGAVAAAFLRDLKTALEDPQLMIL
ncbi:MAG: Dihydrolipoamide acetyltransferase component (E2) of acetoin dehydrogenase complex [Anaerolineae bacterium]|nr:MAG: Dihydrolipoamide acetyltransferase component (E2) of acetoin dehydrogenase complex [Anaerolineae bacterium]